MSDKGRFSPLAGRREADRRLPTLNVSFPEGHWSPLLAPVARYPIGIIGAARPNSGFPVGCAGWLANDVGRVAVGLTLRGTAD